MSHNLILLFPICLTTHFPHVSPLSLSPISRLRSLPIPRLAGSNADQIRNAANFANAADTLLAPVRRLLQGIPGWDEDNNKLEQALGLQGRSKRK